MLAVTAEQMRNLDRRTIEETGIPGAVLMENAGRTAYQVIHRAYGPFAGRNVAVFAGRGNNGGDGFVLARYFHQDNARVQVLLLASMDRVSGDARVNLEICRSLGVPILEVTAEEDLKNGIPFSPDLVIDALLGTGLNSEVRGLYRLAVETINASGNTVVAVDIPSGLDSNRGRVLGEAVRADLTVTFGLPKTGQLVHPGRTLCGTLVCVDISIPKHLIREEGVRQSVLTPDVLALPEPRRPDAHKGHFGHLLVLAGSPGKTGAAALACTAAARVGTGLVTLGVPRSLNPVLEAKLTEPMTEPLAETGRGTLGMESLEVILELSARKTALAVGPGLSTHPETVELVWSLLRQCTLPMVLDADALNAVAQNPDILKEVRAPVALTPHPGEMARLIGGTTRQVQSDRISAARAFAREYNVVLVLKGARTVIALPDETIFINPTGNPGLASGGAGDVLTGIIGGLAAQGMPLAEAAKTGVYLHGRTADRCSVERGACGYLAADLCELLPGVLASIKEPSPDADPPVPLTYRVP